MIPQIPHIPEVIRNGKFIQLDINALPFLGISCSSECKHGEILMDTLNDAGIEWMIGEEDNLFKKKFPSAIRLGVYNLVGAGKFDYVDGVFVAYGISVDYHTRPCMKHFENLRIFDPNFRYRIDYDKR